MGSWFQKYSGMIAVIGVFATVIGATWMIASDVLKSGSKQAPSPVGVVTPPPIEQPLPENPPPPPPLAPAEPYQVNFSLSEGVDHKDARSQARIRLQRILDANGAEVVLRFDGEPEQKLRMTLASPWFFKAGGVQYSLAAARIDVAGNAVLFELAEVVAAAEPQVPPG